jgi:hypothetical protein
MGLIPKISKTKMQIKTVDLSQLSIASIANSKCPAIDTRIKLESCLIKKLTIKLQL